MAINIMNNYIKMIKSQITEYVKYILQNKFNKKIFDKYLDGYIYTKYNSYIQTNKTLKTRLLEDLNQQEENINVLFENKNKINIQMHEIFEYIVNIEESSSNKNIENLLDKLSNKREEILKKKDENFKEEFLKLIKKFAIEKEKFFDKYESEDFSLKISNYKTKINVQRVNINYNFNVSPLYSKFAIEKAFNTGVTNEDKLFVEYLLISIRLIKEIIKGNYTKQYILEFSETLLNKKQKLEKLLSIIDNEAIKEKMSLKIKYDAFTKYKDEIYEIINRGFKVSVILDNSFEENYENVQKIELFTYILINEDISEYSIIPKRKTLENKIIKI